MRYFRIARDAILVAMAVWFIGLSSSTQVSAAGGIVVLKEQGTNPLYDFGMAVGASGGNNKFIVADFDGDGDTDLVNRNTSNTGVQYWRNNGDGSFTDLTGSSNPFQNVTFSGASANYFSTLYLLTGDFDGDGDVDVFNGNHQGSSALYRNDGGTFTVLQGPGVNPLHGFGTAIGTGGFRAIAADFDGDGDTDLVNRNSNSTGVQYWRNNGDGTFTELTGTANPLASVSFVSNSSYFTAPLLAAGDFDGDGDVDIFNGNHGGTPAMYRNDGGTFTVLQGAGTNPLHESGTAIGTTTGKFVAGDFDGDGWVDFVNRNSANTGVQYWKNNGDGTFAELTGSSNPFASVSFSANVNYFFAGFLAVGDFDGDGDKDILNVNHGGTPALYQQSGSPPNLTGTVPTDDAVSVASSDPIQLIFNETIASGGPGVIEIRKYSDDSLVESIAGNSAEVTGFGSNVITIHHPAPLQNNTAYYILIKPRAFFDSDGQSFPGISKKSQLNYTTQGNSIQQYPVRSGAVPSSSYTLSVNGENIFVEKFGDVSFARFSFSGTANFTVTANETVSSFGISPQSYQIQGSSSGNHLFFSIDQPRTLIVSVNNLEKLFLFADGLETAAPDIHDPNVINLADYLPAGHDEEAVVTGYFQKAIDDTSALNNGAGGILLVPDGKYMTAQLKLRSNVHLYLKSGAWIKAVSDSSTANYPAQNGSDSSFIFIQNASHVKISGRGMIDGNGMAIKTLNDKENIKLLRTADVTDLQIEDVYFVDSARWTIHLLYAEDVVLKNIKLINDLRGAPDPANPNILLPTVTNTDGVDIDSSQNVTIDGSFIYTGDDSISPKVTNYLNLKRPTFGLQIKNNVIWTLKAALKVGDETLMDIGGVRFENNDIVHADRFVALWAGDASHIQNIDVINNWAEFIGGNYNERYFYFRIRLLHGDSKPGWIDQVHVKDFYVLNKAVQASTIEGYDATHLVSNVTFDNVVIQGAQAGSRTDIPLEFKNTFYSDVVFQPSGTVYSGTQPPPPLQINTPGDHSITNNPNPLINGTAMANSTVKVYVDHAPPVTVTADASYNWSYAPIAALSEGLHTVKATAVDAAGNDSADSSIVTFTVDLAAPYSTIFIEAEDMTLVGYMPEVQSVASGGKVIKVSGTGTATMPFNGQDGTYDLKVHYFDENDGAATYRMFVNDLRVDAWTANQDLGSASVSEKSRTSRWISGIPLRKGDIVKLEGTSNASEAARVDCLEFNLMTEPDPSNPPFLDSVRVSGTVPVLTAGGAGYDLYGLTVIGMDQFGSSYDLAGLPKSWTVKTGTGFSTVNGTILNPLSAGSGTVTLTVYGKESNSVAFTVQAASNGEPRVLLVDKRGITSGAYTSISKAVASTPALKPGDIISLVPGSGPYHETVKIHASGVPGKPIIFEGNGELISGFIPFQFTQEANGQWTYTLPAPIANTLPDGKSSTFRHLVAYNGQRLLLDQPSGQNTGIFTSDYAVLSSDGSKLILNPDKASPTSGWEISTLTNGIEIVTPDSYQTYRNLRVTGVQNDGFNIHGTGTGLVFENIEAFNNFDEGFSSHDSTNSTIEGGAFWGNENGIYNQSRDTVTFKANNVKVYNNIGYGVATQMGTNSFSNVQVWDNGISNLRVGGRVFMSNVVTYDSRWSQRPWVGFQESQNYKYNQEIKPYAYSEYVKADYPITKTGTAPTVLPASQLPPFKGAFDDWRHIYFSAADLSNPAISGPESDPDGDG
ncbi:FG-GAP-like repeat-containing protein [Paenibacillus periandrae]|uniref:FG-GAP-like repeat-containing protein n=1 Tax=Paenibacillus periandrae TaxID=1761741 RepID=UPI001F09AA04|nr:FG-GAP-like repeat-containing protein [Paenibacillus periandrae]